MMNELIFNICVSEKIIYKDFFAGFVDRWSGDRLDYLFEDCVHPNRRGMGIIAKEYIRLLHRNAFNPLAY